MIFCIPLEVIKKEAILLVTGYKYIIKEPLLRMWSFLNNLRLLDTLHHTIYLQLFVMKTMKQ